jgi:hypothetical protein
MIRDLPEPAGAVCEQAKPASSKASPVRSTARFTLLAALDTTVASRDPTVQRLKRVEVAQRYKRKPFVYADRRAEEP